MTKLRLLTLRSILQSFLDEIGQGLMAETPNDEGGLTPTQLESPTKASLHQLQKTTITDCAVDVVLSAQSLVGNTTRQKSATAREIYANMIISVWELESEKFYTLTFTHQANDNTSIGSSSSLSRQVLKTNRSTNSPGSVISAASSSRRSNVESNHSSTTTTPSPNTFSPLFPPHGPPSTTRNAISSAPTVLQKATRLRDSMLNVINVPAYGMWKVSLISSARSSAY